MVCEEPEISITGLYKELCSVPIISPELDKYKEDLKKMQTVPWDTHLSLMDRLKAVQTDIPENIPPVTSSAAETLIYSVDDSQKNLDRIWIEENKELWEMINKIWRNAAVVIKHLESKDRKLWSPDEAMYYTEMLNSFKSENDKSDIIQIYEEFVGRFPENLSLQLSYGKYLCGKRAGIY